MVEPVGVGVAVARPLVNVVGKIAGDAVTRKWDKNRLKKALRESPTREFNAAQRDTLESIRLSQSSALVSFLDSIAYANLVERYVVSLINYGQEEAQFLSHSELKQLIRLELEVEHEEADVLAQVVLDHVTPLIDIYLAESSLTKSLPKGFEGATIAKAAAMRAVSERNFSTLSGILTLAPINDFLTRYKAQAVEHFGQILVPSSVERKHAPLSKLFVMPEVRSAKEGTPVDIRSYLPQSPQTRFVLKGDPGGGKSTLARFLTHQLAKGSLEWAGRARIPFFTILRNFAPAMINQSRTLTDQISLECRPILNVEPPSGAIEYLMLNGLACVILDGLDELTDISMRSTLVDSISSFSALYPDVPVMVTSRKIGYEVAPLNDAVFDELEIQGLGDAAIREYATKWFSLEVHADSVVDPVKRASSLLHLTRGITDVRSNPLMLALICSLYLWEGYIPNNRPELYEQCTRYLYQQWDMFRNIETRRLDSLAKNSLYALAFWMLGQDKPGFRAADVESFMASYYLEKRVEEEDDARDLAESFVEYCAGRAWVLTDVGADRSRPLYGFTHRTFMEYFAAKQICRTYTSAGELLNFLLPWIDEVKFEVVSQMCLQILRDSHEDGADEFLTELIDSLEDEPQRLERLTFAIRSLQAVVPAPGLRRRIASLALAWYPNNTTALAIRDLLCASLDNLPVIADQLECFLASIEPHELTAPVACLAIYTRAFCARDSTLYSPTIHGEFWHDRSGTIRAVAHEKLESARIGGYNWLLAHDLATGRTSFREHRSRPVYLMHLLFGEDLPRDSILQPLVTRLLYSMCGVSTFDCDDAVIGQNLSSSEADALVSTLLLNHAPMYTVPSTTPATSTSHRSFPLPSTASDPSILGLYVILTAIEADMRWAHRDPEAIPDRLAYWHRITGNAFLGSRWSDFRVQAEVRVFLSRWLGLAVRLVERDPNTPRTSRHRQLRYAAREVY